MFKKISVIFGLLPGILLAAAGQAAEITGQAVGNGGDANPATFHFSAANVDFQMLDKNGNPLTREGLAFKTYSEDYRIFVNGRDFISALGLTVEGADLSGSQWTNAAYPAAGKLAVDPLSGRFKFHASAWASAKQIDMITNLNAFSSGQLAINSQGIAFCSMLELSDYWSYTARFQPDLGWEAAVRMDSTNSQSTKVVVNDSGQAICTFRASAYNIYANRYLTGAGWQGEELIYDPASTALAPNVAIANNGHALVVFNQILSANYHVCACSLNPSTLTWSSPIQIDSLVNTCNVSSNLPALVMNQTTGEAICAFTQNTGMGTGEAIYANCYQPGAGGWTGAQMITPPMASYPALAMNSQGEAVCVFNYKPGSAQMVCATYYSPGTGWHGLDQVAVGNIDSNFTLWVGMDREGNAMCFFYDATVSGSPTRAYAAFHGHADTGWSSSITVDNNNGESALPRDLAMNENGLAVCSFLQKTTGGGTTRGYVNIFTQTDGWSGPVLADADNGYTISSSRMALNDQGMMITSMAQNNGSSNRIYARTSRCELPGGAVRVNYFAAPTPTLTAIAPDKSSARIVGRKNYPRLGQKTTVNCDLAEAGWISIVVYNLAGEKIKTLENAYHAAGTYSFTWGAENSSGDLSASGVYIVHIRLPNLERKEKVVVIK